MNTDHYLEPKRWLWVTANALDAVQVPISVPLWLPSLPYPHRLDIHELTDAEDSKLAAVA